MSASTLATKPGRQYLRQEPPARLLTDVGAVAAGQWRERGGVEIARSRPNPLSIIYGQDGIWSVSDVLGAAWGVGSSPEEAVADFFRSLDSRLQYLRSNRQRLHLRLLRELEHLGRLFPGR